MGPSPGEYRNLLRRFAGVDKVHRRKDAKLAGFGHRNRAEVQVP